MTLCGQVFSEDEEEELDEDLSSSAMFVTNIIPAKAGGAKPTEYCLHCLVNSVRAADSVNATQEILRPLLRRLVQGL